MLAKPGQRSLIRFLEARAESLPQTLLQGFWQLPVAGKTERIPLLLFAAASRAPHPNEGVKDISSRHAASELVTLLNGTTRSSPQPKQNPIRPPSNSETTTNSCSPAQLMHQRMSW
jgi:hypothetical protein